MREGNPDSGSNTHHGRGALRHVRLGGGTPGHRPPEVGVAALVEAEEGGGSFEGGGGSFVVSEDSYGGGRALWGAGEGQVLVEMWEAHV